MRYKKTLTFIFAVALSGVGFAQSGLDAVRIVQDEMGIGTRALSMGGAYTAMADDYSSIYWNPAGLADVRRSNIVGEFSHLNFSNAATFYETLTEANENYTRVGAIGGVFPVATKRGSLVFALGYNRVKGFDQNLAFSGYNRESNGLSFVIDDVTHEFDKDVRQTEEVINEGGLNHWSFGSGIALSSNVNAGITLSYINGQDDYRLRFTQNDEDNIYNQIPADFDRYLLNRQLVTEYSGFGMKAGTLFKMGALKLGGTVAFPTTFTVHERFTEDDLLTFNDGFEDGVESPPGEFEYKVRTPFTFDAGAALTGKILNLSGSIRIRDWTQTQFSVDNDLIAEPDYQALIAENEQIKQDYRSTTEYRLGAEFFIPFMRTALRAGYTAIPSPLKDASPELDKEFASLGVGLLLDRFVMLELSYLYGTWSQISEDDFTPGGTLEDIETNRILLGLTYRF